MLCNFLILGDQGPRGYDGQYLPSFIPSTLSAFNQIIVDFLINALTQCVLKRDRALYALYTRTSFL